MICGPQPLPAPYSNADCRNSAIRPAGTIARTVYSEQIAQDSEVKEETWQVCGNGYRGIPFLAIGVIVVTASIPIEIFSIDVDPLMPVMRFLIVPFVLMCHPVTAVHIALAKTFGFAPGSFAVVRGALCMLAGLVPLAVIDYAIAQWRSEDA